MESPGEDCWDNGDHWDLIVDHLRFGVEDDGGIFVLCRSHSCQESGEPENANHVGCCWVCCGNEVCAKVVLGRCK
jgi:hypothetical protein